MDDKKIRVKLLPLKSIGGVGGPGDVVMMTEADAEMYVRDGYVEVVEKSEISVELSAVSAQEDHAIMKPQSKRRK